MNLFKLVGSIFIDNDAANDSISRTDQQAESLANKFVSGAKTAAKWSAGVATAAVGVATAVGGAMVKVAEDTREYRNEMAKLETAFDDADHSADTAKKTYQGLQRVLGETEQAVEASNHLAELCESEKELEQWTTICTGVYAKFGASLPIEGLTEAANETAKTGVLTGGLADALNWAGVNEEEFQEKLDKCNSERERSALITETLNGLYSDSAKAYEENNKAVLEANEANERMNEALAMVGDTVEPIVSKVKNYGASLIEKVVPAISEFVTESEEMEFVTGLVSDAVELLETGYEKIEEIVTKVNSGWEKAVSWCREHETEAVSLAIAIGTLTVAMIAYNAANIARRASDIAETIAIYALIVAENAHTVATTIATGATTAFATAIAFLTSPITLAVLAIGALIAIGVALYKNWDKVCEWAEKLKDTVSDKFAEMREKIKNSKLGQATSKVFGAMEKTASETLSNMRKAFDKHGGGIKGVAAAIWEGVKGYWTAGFRFIDNLTGGKLSGIIEVFREKLTKAKNVVKGIIDKIKGFFDFEFKIPQIKLPHFVVKPSGWSVEDLLKGIKPTLDIDWYDKAMDKGMILNKATMFGINSKGQPMVGGETGSETVVGTKSLMSMIVDAVNNANNDNDEKVVILLQNIYSWLVNGGFEMTLIKVLTKHVKIKYRGREIARLVEEYA